MANQLQEAIKRIRQNNKPHKVEILRSESIYLFDAHLIFYRIQRRVMGERSKYQYRIYVVSRERGDDILIGDEGDL